MEIWDERVRLQDARQRAERLQQSFEPTHIRARPEETPPEPQPRRRLDLHWRFHPLAH